MPHTTRQRILVLGVGNALLRDDGAGILVARRLQRKRRDEDAIEFLDGSTPGPALLRAIENVDALILVDAAELGARPGTVRVFENGDLDRQLARNGRTMHEAAIAELITAATLHGRCPRHRALVSIQPAATDWGHEPSFTVAAAIPRACEAVDELARRYRKAA